MSRLSFLGGGLSLPHFPSAEPRIKGPGLLPHGRGVGGRSLTQAGRASHLLGHDDLAGGAGERDEKLTDGPGAECRVLGDAVGALTAGEWGQWVR